MKEIYLTILILVLSLPVFSQEAGHVDVSFASNGIEIEPANIITDEVEFALDGNGKLIVGLNNILATDTTMVVMRFNQDGTNDLTFNGTSASIVDLGEDTYYLKDLEALPDEKILLCGHNKNQKNNFVARLLPNGAMDNTFGTNGYVILDISADSNEIALNIEPYLNGSYLISGHACEKDSTVGYDNFIVKILGNGFIDNTFNNGEPKYYHHGLNDNFNTNLIVQLDGKIILSGSYLYNGTEYIYLERINSSGLTEPTISFPTGSEIGYYNFNNDANTLLKDVIEKETGGFFLAGNAIKTGGSDYDVFILNANNDGALNRDFGLENPYWATTLHDFQYNTADDEIRKIIELKNGELVLAGFTSSLATSEPDAAILGLSPDGSINTDFGESFGETVVDIQGVIDDVDGAYYGREDRLLNAVYDASLNRIYVAGKTWNPDQNKYDLFLAAFHAEDVVSSVNNIKIEVNVRVYPNPAKNHIQVVLDKGLTNTGIISIFDSKGSQILEKAILEKNTEVNLSHLPKGLYLISVNTNSRVYSKTIIKQ